MCVYIAVLRRYKDMFASNILRNCYSGPKEWTLLVAHQHQNCHIQQFARASNVAMTKYRFKQLCYKEA